MPSARTLSPAARIFLLISSEMIELPLSKPSVAAMNSATLCDAQRGVAVAQAVAVLNASTLRVEGEQPLAIRRNPDLVNRHLVDPAPDVVPED